MPASPFDMLWFRLVAGILVGLALGSFATMLSYRVAAGAFDRGPRSQCPACHSVLAPRDLMPVFSWLAAKGKCAHCGTSIGPRYPLIESATTFLTVLAFLSFGFALSLIAALAAIVALVTMVAIVLERHPREGGGPS